MVDKVQMVDLDKVHWDHRYREDLGNIDDLTESIKDKGVLQPITIRPDYTLLAGERRVTAARKAGLKKIPALIRDVKDDDLDMREVELIENVFRKEFTWVEQSNLISEIHRLCKEKHGIDWGTRKTAQLIGHGHPMNVSRAMQLNEAMQVIPELVTCKSADEAFKVIKKFEESLITKELAKRQATEQKDPLVTDTLKIARNAYIIGDIFEEMAQMPNNGVHDLIECDPPYGIDLNEQKRKDDSTTTVQGYKEVERDAYPEFIKRLTKELYRIANNNCWLIFWFGPTHHNLVFTSLKEAGWSVDDIPAIWAKGSGQTNAPEHYLARTYESFFVCRKGLPALHKRGVANVFFETPTAGSKKYHPTERPVKLLENILDVFGYPMSRVFVPFLGSGATLRACFNLGMPAFGFDIDDRYRDKFLLAVEEDVKKLNEEGDREVVRAELEDQEVAE